MTSSLPGRSNVLRDRRSGQIVEYLIQSIAAKVLRVGDPLPSETELALKFAVSKPVVREALGTLSALGMVTIHQGKPTTVAGLTSAPLDTFFRIAIRASDQGLREAIELRRSLEVQIAIQAATRATPEQVDLLRDIVQRMRMSLDRVDALIAADAAFHQALARTSGNSLLEMLMQALSEVTRETARLILKQVDLRDPGSTIARHEAIVEAIARQDVDGVRAAIEHHFDATLPVIDEIARDGRRLNR